MSSMFKLTNVLLSMIPIVFLSSEAFAKKSNRDGLNFGGTVHASNISQPSLILNGEEATAKGKTSLQTGRPYIGYTFGGLFTLGLQGAFHSESKLERLQGEAGSIVTYERTNNLQGAGLFSRFLFGQVMFFETSLGYYESHAGLTAKSVNYTASGAFQGVEESINARSSGLGYRAAVGIEIPVAYDFYVTAAYASNAYDLKAVKVSSGNEKGSFFANQQQVEFGIAYYNN